MDSAGKQIIQGARASCRSYAKVNLYLDVIARRDDGFHDIETVFQTVGLYDELDVEVTEGEVSLSCSDPRLDCGDSNLVMRAANALRAQANVTAGAVMHLEKRIPLASGLAGGSGNAAAALRTLNGLWNCGLDPSALAGLALSLGSDVPYCLSGGVAAGTGRGEVLAQLPGLPLRWVVLVHPDIEVRTASVYGHPELGLSSEAPVRGRTARFASAMEAFAAGNYAAAVYNRMEKPVLLEHSELSVIKSELLAAGCEAALMSGSGPTIFGLCGDEACARRVASAVAPRAATVAPFTDQGVRVL